MAAEYIIIVKTRAGMTKRVLTGQRGGFRQLSYTRVLNGVGTLMFDLDSDHDAIADLEQDGQVEVWRRDTANSIDWYCDFYGLFVDEERSADDNGNTLYRAICPDQMDFIKREYVLWYANTANRSLFSAIKAETILKTLATYNITASATTGNGRLYTTDIANISVAADGAGGNTITFYCAQQNLLEAMQDIARIGDRDFYLTKTGAQAWQFNTAQYLGMDRSASVSFALGYGNMSNPVLKRNRLNEITVVVVGGQGDETTRPFVRRTGTNYNSSYNSKVLFYPATEYTTTAGLNAAGDVKLDELRAKDDLAWTILQTPSSLYGYHYFFGDVVTGYFQGVTATKQIAKVTVTFAPSDSNPESINVETVNI
jgi:Siphovirus ReqiPepy6 Gp37-like protein